MNAEPCDPPVKHPLAPRVPEVTHRELPNGKGFLRVIDGGKSKAVEPAKPPTPPTPVRYTTPHVEDYERHWDEMDFKLRKQQEKRMDFFGEDSDKNPNW